MITSKHFMDWEAFVFGYGYGSGDQHTILALREFLELTDDQHPGYDYTNLEFELGPRVTWLLINTLCHAGILEYGTSARFGWLTTKGKMLREFMLAHTGSRLVEMVADRPDEYVHCLPDHCNCVGEKCNNPLFLSAVK